MLLMNRAVKEQLEQALGNLGWGHYEGDLWRHKQTGVIVGFLDAVVMELQTSVHQRKMVEGHLFKEPVEFTVKSDQWMIWMHSLISYSSSVLRKLRLLFPSAWIH